MITHSHIDHYNPTIFRYRGSHYAPNLCEIILHVYAPSAVKEIYDGLERGKPSDTVRKNIDFTASVEFESFSANHYAIHPLLASHMSNEKCYIYVIEKDGKRVLFGNDSGFYPKETFDYLKDMRLDLVFLDCTYGLTSRGTDDSHMNFFDNLKVRDRFYQNGSADDNTIFVCHHLAHICLNTHDELCYEMEKHGFQVSYDGMTFSI